MVLHTFEGDCNSYAKTSARNIKSICLKYGHTNLCFYVGIRDTLEANLVHVPKMMLPATQTSCLKNSHTNFQLNVGIGITYFGERLQFVCKN